MATPTLPANPPANLKITPQALQTLARAYGFTLPDKGLILFALRGLCPDPAATPMTGWHDQAHLLATGVDYLQLRCTLGIWNVAEQKLFIALGSTVPHADQVALAAAKTGAMKGRGTNQLEPGLYSDLTKGEHLQGKVRGHAALRQTGFRFYRRSHHTAPYKKSDPLYFGNPYDNLHCAWNLDGQAPGYSSAGCLVVAGMPHCARQSDSGPNRGAWKTFHDLIYAAKQKSFTLFLLSGVEVGRVLGEDAAGGGKSGTAPVPRLVFGSRGEAVKTLQRKLIKAGKMQGKPTGYLGTTTYRAWNAAGLSGYGDVLGC
jgi:hypothetical protein